MAVNYDLTMTGPEVQKALDNVAVNHEDILQEAETRELSDEALNEKDVDLQNQINEIVSGDATISLAVNKTAIFVGQATEIGLTATTNVAASLIKISGGSLAEPIQGSGKTLTGTDTLTPSAHGSTQYTAKFTISGIEKTAPAKTVSFVYPIYVGAGENYADADFESLSARTSPAGATLTLQSRVGDHIFIEVPQGMSVSKLFLVGAFDTELGIETEPTSRVDAEGRPYTCYRNIEPRGAGTYTYKLA